MVVVTAAAPGMQSYSGCQLLSAVAGTLLLADSEALDLEEGSPGTPGAEKDLAGRAVPVLGKA